MTATKRQKQADMKTLEGEVARANEQAAKALAEYQVQKLRASRLDTQLKMRTWLEEQSARVNISTNTALEASWATVWPFTCSELIDSGVFEILENPSEALVLRYERQEFVAIDISLYAVWNDAIGRHEVDDYCENGCDELDGTILGKLRQPTVLSYSSTGEFIVKSNVNPASVQGKQNKTFPVFLSISEDMPLAYREIRYDWNHMLQHFDMQPVCRKFENVFLDCGGDHDEAIGATTQVEFSGLLIMSKDEFEKHHLSGCGWSDPEDSPEGEHIAEDK